MWKKDLLLNRWVWVALPLFGVYVYKTILEWRRLGGWGVWGRYLVDEEEDLYDRHLWSMAAVNIHSWSP